MKKQFDGEIVCLLVEEYHPVMKFDAIWAYVSLIHQIKEEYFEVLYEEDVGKRRDRKNRLQQKRKVDCEIRNCELIIFYSS